MKKIDPIKDALRKFSPNSDTEITFGVEIEFCTPHNVSGGNAHNKQNRQRVADLLARMTDLKVRQNNYSGSDYTAWQVKSDCSVTNEDLGADYAGGFELVSPVLQGLAGMADLHLMCYALRALRCKVNKSCGIHVHFGIKSFFENKSIVDANPDAPKANLDEIARRIMETYAEYEPQIDSLTDKTRRAERNTYCRSTRALVRDINHTNNIDIKHVDITYDMDDYDHHDRRYHKVNFTTLHPVDGKGTVEIRQLHGTLDSKEIADWIWLHQKLIHRSLMGGLIAKTRLNQRGRTFAQMLGFIRCDRNKFGRDSQTTNIVNRLRDKHAAVSKDYGWKLTDRIDDITSYTNPYANPRFINTAAAH